jgi:hypothetical protein
MIEDRGTTKSEGNPYTNKYTPQLMPEAMLAAQLPEKKGRRPALVNMVVL